jgi:hypothetical protein
MKFSSAAAVSALAGLSTASKYQPGTHTQRVEVDVVCTDPPAYTVTETVTVYAQPPQFTTTPFQAPSSTTHGGYVTSYDYSGSQTSVWVYPTDAPSKHDCTVGVYEGNTVITVIIVNVDVTINNGQTVTSTVTKTDKPTYTPPPPAPPALSTTTPPTPGQTHTVIVGENGDFLYGPNQLDAEIGDVIKFDFLAKNHTVTQSSFKEPCSPLADGFDTGFNQFNPHNISGAFVKYFPVTTKKPQWFYCKQTVPVSHCNKGMVLGINPAGKFDQFLWNAEHQNVTVTAPGNGTTGSGSGNSTTPGNGTEAAYKSYKAPTAYKAPSGYKPRSWLA